MSNPLNISVVIPTRNDNYGGNLLETAVATLNTMSITFGEVIVVDFGSETPFYQPLKELIEPSTRYRNIRIITVPRSWVLEKTGNDQTMADTWARNIGLRRASGEYLLSSNIDIIPAPKDKHSWDTCLVSNKFWTSPKYMIDQPWVASQKEQGFSWEEIQEQLLSNSTKGSYYRQPIHTADPWSKVSGCGDFQLGHRDVWYHPQVRGYEESMILRNYADSNLHKKVEVHANIPVEVAYDVHIFHQSHHQPTGAAWNDPHPFLEGFCGTTNTEDWGFVYEQFEEFNL